MKKALLASAACAALGLASMAQAAVVATIIDKGVPSSATVTATGYHGYVIRLTSNTGNITGVDASGTRGITGQMIQRWTDPDSPDGTGAYTVKTPTGTAQNSTANVANFDSHFIPPGNDVGNMLVGSAMTEDAVIPPSGSPFPPFGTNTTNAGFGTGSFLRGAYGIAAAAQSPSLDVAYVVVKDNVQDPFTFQIATANGTFDVNGTVPAIPEPATLSLAGLSALGLVGRRRRA